MILSVQPIRPKAGRESLIDRVGLVEALQNSGVLKVESD